MGFWHTGYMEHHEISGLGDFTPDLSPRTFKCKYCGNIYPSVDELRKHRFESHLLRRPTLFLRGRELGADSVRVTQYLGEDDVNIDCDQAFLNGKEIYVDEVAQELAHITSDNVQLKLCKDGVPEEFKLNFCIATKEDIQEVERRFEEMILGRRLDSRVIDDFINATEKFDTAIGYCHGICQYLYGVMAKERYPDSSLPYDKYVDKYNEAVNNLADYERPLARTIGGLIEFHFNHFEESAQLAGKTSIRQVAGRYAGWMRGEVMDVRYDQDTYHDSIEKAIMDCHTEQIICWIARSQDKIHRCIAEIESFLMRGLEKYDDVKVRILLGEIYSGLGDSESAAQYAKNLRNLPAPVGEWAEAMVRRNSKYSNEKI